VEDDIRDKFKAESCHLPAKTGKKHKELQKKCWYSKNMHLE